MGLKLNIAHVINSIPCTNEINSIQNFINGKKKKKVILHFVHVS